MTSLDPLPKRPMHVLVTGAGVTGLLIAQGLKKSGINASVFEREASAQTYRPREWTMGIHWALPMLESLLPDDLKTRLANETFTDSSVDWEKFPNNHMRMFNGITGEIMKDIPISGKIVRVSRRKLRHFLAQGIEVKYDHQIVDVKHQADSVSAIFSNGTQVLGDLIIGCDGPVSTVRSLLLGPEAAATQALEGVIHCNTSYNYADAEKAKFIRAMHPVWAMAMHPDIFSFTSIADVPEPEKPETWVFQIVAGWLGDRGAFPTSEARMTELKRRAERLAEPFRSAIMWLPDDLPVTFDPIKYWESAPWDTQKGRITLAGDAAHPMPPHRGQGLNHAIQDVYNLVRVLTTHASSEDCSESEQMQLAKDIQEYSDEAVSRGAAEIRLSIQNAFMALNWKTFEQSPMMKHALDKSPSIPLANDEAVQNDRKNPTVHNGEVQKENEVTKKVSGTGA